jgi:hypothetical protein
MGKSGIFEKTPFFDDGLHGDGAASDYRWSTTVPYYPGMQFYVVTEDEKSAFAYPRKSSAAPITVK